MGASGGAGGGRAARALRALLLLVMALAAVEYLFGSILDASPLRNYLYTPLYNATQPTVRNRPNRQSMPIPSVPPTNSEVNVTDTKNSSYSIASKQNRSLVTPEMTKQENASTPRLISKIMEGIRTMVSTDQAADVKGSALPLCDKMPPDLGPIKANKTAMALVDIEKKYPEVSRGGIYAPPNCTARHRVAIIVPFRDRSQHLAIFLNHMHPFLMKQQLEYGIFIIEQEGNREFNRAKLFNVGFVESQKLHFDGTNRWQCFVFHDVDLLPLDLRNMYSCPRQPRHMSASIDKHNNRLLYDDLFGGVSAMTVEQFTKVNGFSNKYWGWGAEDDDIASRIKTVGYHIARYSMSIARYAMLKHRSASPNPKRYQLLSQTSKNFKKDGLSTLNYELVGVVRHHLYTQITVNIEERS